MPVHDLEEIELRKVAVAHFLEANLSGEMDNYFKLWHSGFIQRPDGFMTAMEKVVENSKKETEKARECGDQQQGVGAAGIDAIKPVVERF